MSNEVKDTGMVLKIGHLYPTLMSVAADRGNLFSIERRCKWRGIATEVEQIFVKQTPDFTNYDLILFHGGADREMELASRDIQANFFFQAEDGIRDLTVTGVQTCALPIYPAGAAIQQTGLAGGADPLGRRSGRRPQF